MKTELYWIPAPWPGRLAIMPRPRGGDWLEDEIQAWCRAGVGVVVSLLTPDEVADLGLAEEETLCRASGIEFFKSPIPDREVPPSSSTVSELLATLRSDLAEGKNVAIHCRQGIGRAALIAISLLVLSGMDPDAAIRSASAARGCSVPETPEQRQWITDFAKRSATHSQ
jgi:protein-tyrosine phosphatase